MPYYEETGAHTKHRRLLDRHLDELVEIVEVNTYDPDQVKLKDIDEKLNILIKNSSEYLTAFTVHKLSASSIS